MRSRRLISMRKYSQGLTSRNHDAYIFSQGFLDILFLLHLVAVGSATQLAHNAVQTTLFGKAFQVQPDFRLSLYMQTLCQPGTELLSLSSIRRARHLPGDLAPAVHLN
eukprot:m.67654 g.67654  ORF g.67654 m.67654 type:complete len:108 (-) comp13644_c1_seq1:574-897(-)